MLEMASITATEPLIQCNYMYIQTLYYCLWIQNSVLK